MKTKKYEKFMEELDYLLSEIRNYAENTYLSKETKNHGLTNSQFISFCVINVLSIQSCIFDRHNERVDKKLKKKAKK